MDSAEITEPIIALNIRQHYRPGMSEIELYDVTRGVWRVGKQRTRIDYAFAVFDGKVIEIYEVHEWHPAATTTYNSGRTDQTDPRYADRWEFTGVVARSEIRNKHLGRSLNVFQRGAQNPVRYL